MGRNARMESGIDSLDKHSIQCIRLFRSNYLLSFFELLPPVMLECIVLFFKIPCSFISEDSKVTAY